MGKRGRYKKYTEEQKQEILVLLEKNNGNLSRTSDKTGVPIKTLQTWRDHYEVITKAVEDADSEELANIDPEYAKSIVKIRNRKLELAEAHDVSFLDSAHELATQAYHRMMELMPAEKDLHKLAGVYKIATDAHNNILKRPTEQENKDKQGAVQIFGSLTQYIQNNDNSK